MDSGHGKHKNTYEVEGGLSHLSEAGALFISQDSDQHASISINPGKWC